MINIAKVSPKKESPHKFDLVTHILRVYGADVEMYKIYEAEVFTRIFKSDNTRLTFPHNSKLVSFQFLLMQPVQPYSRLFSSCFHHIEIESLPEAEQKYPEINQLKLRHQHQGPVERLLGESKISDVCT